ncbi:response regulator [Microscilla marina]|uniref:Two-component response regulator involved in modulation of flagellar, CheY n=1 Tax=Microscilla marina ATCC 23134 TaxID=313606 RepID=A1ZIZ6_MICM2|nr:response regulator [Microscilla marina]EAY29532.1 two-component response regulator involved in modulation of flagellar, CheY [Microscilla marina ATCC 23134]
MNKSTVLLVDDDEITNFLCKKMLTELGFQSVESATNGQEAIKCLQHTCPDFIFLDIKMPVMDGFEFLEELKILALCQHTKIIMLTSSSREKEIKQASAYSNVIDFVVKPLTKQKASHIFKHII